VKILFISSGPLALFSADQRLQDSLNWLVAARTEESLMQLRGIPRNIPMQTPNSCPNSCLRDDSSE
jgi:hypothetical protein